MGKNRNFYQNNEENIEVTEPLVDEVVTTESAPVETPIETSIEAPVVDEVKPAEPIVEVKVEPEVKKVEVKPAPAPVKKSGIVEIKAKGTATL